MSCKLFLAIKVSFTIAIVLCCFSCKRQPDSKELQQKVEDAIEKYIYSKSHKSLDRHNFRDFEFTVSGYQIGIREKWTTKSPISGEITTYDCVLHYTVDSSFTVVKPGISEPCLVSPSKSLLKFLQSPHKPQ